jgi:hypothetical protein
MSDPDLVVKNRIHNTGSCKRLVDNVEDNISTGIGQHTVELETRTRMCEYQPSSFSRRY